MFAVKTENRMKKEAPKFVFPFSYEKLRQETIDDDFILLEDFRLIPFFDYPTKINFCVSTICLKGYIKGAINLKECMLSENNFLVVLPGQIVQYSYVSDDFSGLTIVMSKRFADNLELNIKDSVSIFLQLKENPLMPLSAEEMELLTDYYAMLRKTLGMTRNPHRMEMVRLLAQAFFYGINNFKHSWKSDSPRMLRKKALFESFYNAILTHYKESREVQFYAGKLCLTPKYLSTVIKEITGKSANEWINDYVILEAKSLLKSTGMTIQQIADELNFANQSFFGKYFRQHTDMSPKEYRKN